MPQRTRSKRARSVNAKRAAEFAAWTRSNWIPAARNASSTSPNWSSCSPVYGLSGSSATARCVRTPSRRSSVRAVIDCASANAWSTRQPTRCMPVSTFRWTGSGSAPESATALASASMPAGVYTTGVRPSATTAAAASGGGSDSTRTGASIPTARSSAPSSTSATPSHAAPASRAARATGTAPWPYPSAFTTAIRAAGRATSASVRTLARTASRSISAQTGRYVVTSRCVSERRLASLRNASRWVRPSGRLRQEPDEVAAGDDADELVVVDDGNVGDVSVVHLRRQSVEGVVGLHGRELGDHDVGDGGAGGLLELVLEAVQRRRHHEVGAEERDHGGNMEAGLGHDEVLVAEKAHDLAGAVDNGRGADLLAGEDVGRFLDRLVGPQRHDVAGHHRAHGRGVGHLFLQALEALQQADGRRERVEEVAGDEASMPGDVGRPPMDERPAGGGPERVRAAGEEAADDPRQHVAGAGAGQPWADGRVDRGAPRRFGDHLARPLQQHDGVRVLGEPARRRQSVRADLLARQVHVLTRVRGEHGRSGAGAERPEVAVEGVETVGVEHERDGRLGHHAAHGGRGAVVAPEAGTDDQDPEPIDRL